MVERMYVRAVSIAKMNEHKGLEEKRKKRR